ncbi:MAG TPA: DNA polymerase III subunit gamma/tau [Dongiaceae bacterium]|nr:DNA polymerase III subunit gamma/tau [Dongiaceae bacterium]
MSYQVLARKWRPKTFREMVGQEHVLKALINALDHGRLHHAYLFTGTRGVGKTTIARILAKSLNCEIGISSEPCGQCSACMEINEGRFIDLIEVDAASRTKVEDTRELLENVQYAPTRGRYKVYLIDEVHMLSGHSFNALLKTLEEPPPHVKFLLATTDPQKLPITILSRCLQFSLKAMTPDRIVGHLKKVLEAEMVAFEEPALWQLGRAADGSMRDALSLTDQAIAFGSGKVVEMDVRAMLGSIDREYVFGIVEALASGDAKVLLQTVADMAQQSPDFSGVLGDLISTLHRMAVAQLAPDAVDDSDGDRQRILEQATRFAPEQLQLFYQTALLGRRDLPLAPDARSGFEMILLRMLLFKPQSALPTGPASGTATAGGSGGGKSASPAPAGQSKPAAAPVALDESMPVRALGGAGEHLARISASLNAESARSSASRPASAPASGSAAGSAASASATTGSATVGTATSVSHSAANANVVAMPTRPAQSDGRNRVQESSPSRAPGNADTRSNASQPSSQASAVAKPVPAQTTSGKSTVPANKTSEPAAPPKAPVLLGDEWSDLITTLTLDGPIRNFARNSCLEQKQDDTWQLSVSRRFEALYKDEHREALQNALADKLGQPLKLKVSIQEPGKPTPDQLLATHKEQRRKQAVELMQGDDFVQTLQQQFGATLDLNSVTPTDD